MRKQLLAYLQIILILIFCIQPAQAQKIVFEKPIKFQVSKIAQYKIESVFPIVSSKKELALLINDETTSRLITLNNDFQETNFYPFEKLQQFSFQKLLGYSIQNHNYFFYYVNQGSNKLLVHTVKPEQKENDWQILPLKFKKEKIFEAISVNDRLHVFSVEKNSSILKMHVFSGGELHRTEKFDFSDFQFSSRNIENHLYGQLSELDGTKLSLVAEKIDLNYPLSLEHASAKNKIIYNQENVFITLDESLKRTILISINLKDLSSSIRAFRHTESDCSKASYFQSNSFVTRQLFFQVQGCETALSFQVIDLENRKLRASYIHNEANTGADKSLKEISTGNLGIMASISGTGLIDVNVGSYLKHNAWRPDVTDHRTYFERVDKGSVTATILNLDRTLIHQNASFVSFQASLNRTAFEQVNISTKEDILERIDYFKENEADAEAFKLKNKMVFKFGENYVYSYFDKRESKFIMRLFETKSE